MTDNIRIDTLSAETVSKLVAAYNPLKDFKKDAYLDAHDGRAWRVSIVTKDDDGIIGIHYEGWSPKFDEAGIKLPSAKILPFRRMTVGYTGQPKQAYREFKYDKETKERVEKELRKIMSDGFVVSDPVRYTQFVRGETFFFVDSLLTMLQTAPPSKAELQQILEFLRLVLLFIAEWIKVSSDLSPELEMADKHEWLYLVHSRTSVAKTYPEIAAVLGTFLGACKRSLDSYKVPGRRYTTR